MFVHVLIISLMQLLNIIDAGASSAVENVLRICIWLLIKITETFFWQLSCESIVNRPSNFLIVSPMQRSPNNISDTIHEMNKDVFVIQM